MPIALTANTATRATLSALLPAAIRVFLAVYWLRQYARCYAYCPNGQYGYAGYAFGAIACGNTRFFSGLLATPIRPLLRLLA